MSLRADWWNLAAGSLRQKIRTLFHALDLSQCVESRGAHVRVCTDRLAITVSTTMGHSNGFTRSQCGWVAVEVS